MLDLKRTTDYGKTIKTVANNIFSFGLGGRFLFASVMTGKVRMRSNYRLQDVKRRAFLLVVAVAQSYR